tara:strand:+ start:267 stop:782 length:516 start_codon:yes stop_codon:yes gene_type:complete
MIFLFKMSDGGIALTDNATSLEEAQEELTANIADKGITIDAVYQGVDPVELNGIKETAAAIEDTMTRLSHETGKRLVSLAMRNVMLIGRAQQVEAESQALKDYIAQCEENAEAEVVETIAAVLCWQQGVNYNTLEGSDLEDARMAADTFLTGMAMGMEEAAFDETSGPDSE